MDSLPPTPVLKNEPPPVQKTQTPSSNNLGHESSPYLLQHASNPFHWYPWGDKPFQLALQRDCLVFLSIGYFTCHWCHVQMHETFENTEIAEFTNKNFVCIKVDREQRIDIDSVYMSFVQATTGSGGWPLTLFLDPNTRYPICGFTYLHPKQFTRLTRVLSQDWQNPEQRLLLIQESKLICKQIAQRNQNSQIISIAKHISLESSIKPPSEPMKILYNACDDLSQQFDPEYGGFSKNPKFACPTQLLFLISMIGFNMEKYKTSTPKHSTSTMLFKTLDSIAQGGIHDHVGGGFHRYSVDKFWKICHYEKMLYDNALLLETFALASQKCTLKSRKILYTKACISIIRYLYSVLWDHKNGACFSGQDADSIEPGQPHPVEGACYVWNHQEIVSILGEKSQLFCGFYGITPQGNAPEDSDPHGIFKEKNCLFISENIQNFVQSPKFAHLTANLSVDQLELQLQESLVKVHAVRNKRHQPAIDTKLLVGWNALLLSGLVAVKQVFGDSLDAQIDDAFLLHQSFKSTQKRPQILNSMIQHLEKFILSSISQSKSSVTIAHSAHISNQFAQNYSFVIRGLISLYQFKLNPKLLEIAILIQNQQEKLFHSPNGYFSWEANAQLFSKDLDSYDGVLPSTNSASVFNLFYLGHLLKIPKYIQRANAIIQSHFQGLFYMSTSLNYMLFGYLFHHNHISVISTEKSPKPSIFGTTWLTITPQTLEFLKNTSPIMYSIGLGLKSPQYVVCIGKTCLAPVNTFVECESLLLENSPFIAHFAATDVAD